MLSRSLLLFPLLVCSLGAADAGLNQVKFVYLLSMSGGLDQYLANRLVQNGRFQVVTDPEKADAILTDRLGADFERRMKELYPPPPPPEEEKAKEEAEENEQGRMNIGSAFGEVAGQKETITGSFSRGKGNVFLVDRESRQVVWSHYMLPRSTRPDELNHVANKIADKLDVDAKRATKAAAAPPQSPPAP